MKLKKALLAGAALVAALGTPAQASILDNPHFRVLGLVIVWSGDASGDPIVSDFVIGTGSGGDDLIAADGRAVVTGQLQQTPTSLAGASTFDVTSPGSAPNFQDNGTAGVLDAADTFDAFTLTPSTDVSAPGAELKSSFFVASNTPFNILADADVNTATGDFTLASVGFAMSHTNDDPAQTNFGDDANASVGANEAGFDDLGDFETEATIFTGTVRTADTPGTIMDQSVRFDVTYTLGGAAGYDLSMGAGEIDADVTYTVFVP
ncbi:MAG: hypothetical protein AAF753_02245 [Pseudomonadota bacterium]